MRAVRKCERKHTAGFTLLELVIAISILGLVVLMMADGVQFAGAVWERGSKAHAKIEDELVGRNAFRRYVSQALPLSVGRTRLTRSPVAFVGERHQMRFVAPPPDHIEDGALRLFDLRIETSNDTSRLVMQTRPLQPDLSDFDQDANAHESLLQSDFADAVFSYFRVNLNQQGGEWFSEWKEQPDLPSLVKLTFEQRAADRTVPSVVFVKIHRSQER